jgi:hypothetical protein
MRDLAECQGIILSVRVDHARIRKSLLGVLHTFRTVDRRARRVEIAVQMIEPLTSLSAQLRRHFAAEEEEGGSLEEAVCCCPSLSHEARQVDQEHPKLLAELEAIIARLRNPTPHHGGTAEDQRLLEQFADRLQRHEATENRILSLAFGGTFDEDAI